MDAIEKEAVWALLRKLCARSGHGKIEWGERCKDCNAFIERTTLDYPESEVVAAGANTILPGAGTSIDYERKTEDELGVR